MGAKLDILAWAENNCWLHDGVILYLLPKRVLLGQAKEREIFQIYQNKVKFPDWRGHTVVSLTE